MQHLVAKVCLVATAAVIFNLIQVMVLLMVAHLIEEEVEEEEKKEWKE